MKFFVNFLLIISMTCNVYARELGQTEITAADGIEVYQDEIINSLDLLNYFD